MEMKMKKTEQIRKKNWEAKELSKEEKRSVAMIGETIGTDQSRSET